MLFALLAGGGYLLVDSLTGDDSGGTVTVIVPNVVGETQAAAEAELEELGLEVDVRRREVDPDETEPGTVVAQDPRRDEEVARGSTVTITVAVEPDTVVVPSLEGLTVSQAQSELRAADLTLGSTLQEASADIDEGLVIRSEPAVDAEVEPGSAVDIYVSTGPEMVEVPDVSTGCLSVGAARQALRGRWVSRWRSGNRSRRCPTARTRAGSSGRNRSPARSWKPDRRSRCSRAVVATSEPRGTVRR